MDENKELVEYLREYKAEKIIRAKRLAFITNIILIILFIAIGLYVYYNIEAFKTLGQDVCKLCMEKNGGNLFQYPK